jgi:nitrate reductase cytochrome c-type subunit
LASAAGVLAADTIVGKYNGAGGCAASSCHGSIQPKTTTRVPQTEYTIWAGHDKHARAYQVLSNPVSIRIGRILKLDHPPNQTQRCLACHALAVPQEQRAETFDITDGVSCESCHGPASGWLGQHTVKDWPHERSVKDLGMIDLRDVAVRTHVCLHCHLGTAEKSVDHELIAAGHPDLTFELNLFSAVMPRHWKDPKDTPWIGTKEWAVGQGMQLRDGLDRLSRRARSSAWPEFAEADCFACHHSLTKPEDSWRLVSEDYYGDRKAGVPPWNSSRYVVFRYAAKEVDAAAAEKLEAEIASLVVSVNQLNADRERIGASADRASSLAHSLAGELNDRSYDGPFTLRVMRRIAADANPISAKGQRVAEQAAMALDSLFVVYKKNVSVANERELRTAIDQLFQQLDNPSAYNAPRFAAQMQKVSALLPPT